MVYGTFFHVATFARILFIRGTTRGPFDMGYLLHKGIAGSNPVTSPIMEVWLSGLRQIPCLSFVRTFNN